MAANGGAAGGNSGSIRAGKAHVEMSAKDAGLSKALDMFTKRLRSFGKTVATIGGAVSGAGSAGLGGIFATLAKSVDRASEIKRLSDKLGVGTEQMSEFAYAAQTTGMSLEELTGQFENLAERVAQGAAGTGEAAETFKKLGIDAKQLALQNPIEQMITLAKAMEGVTNQTERLGMLSSLGGDQFQWMENLFRQGPNGIRKLMGEAREVGASLNGEVATNAVKAERAFSRAWTAIKNSVLAVGEALLPQIDTIEQVAAVVVHAAKAVRQFINENKSLVVGVTAGLAALMAIGGVITTVGLGFAALGIAIAGLVAGVGAIGSALALLATPVGIVSALFVGLGAVFVGVLDELGMLDKLFVSLGETWTSLRTLFGTGFEGIKAALSVGDFSTAFQIGLATLGVLWEKFLLALEGGWAAFKGDFVDGWETLTANIKSLWVQVSHSIATAMNAVATRVSDMFGELVGNIARKLGSVLEAVLGQRLVRDYLGTGATKQLRGLADRMKEVSNPQLYKSRQGELDDGLNAIQLKISEDLKRNLIDREVSRDADIKNQLDRVKGAELTLKSLVEGAKLQQEIAEKTKLAMEALGGVFGVMFASQKASIVEGVKSAGTLGGFNADRAAQQFGAAPRVFDKIENNTNEAKKLLKDMVDKIDGVRAEYA